MNSNGSDGIGCYSWLVVFFIASVSCSYFVTSFFCYASTSRMRYSMLQRNFLWRFLCHNTHAEERKDFRYLFAVATCVKTSEKKSYKIATFAR